MKAIMHGCHYWINAFQQTPPLINNTRVGSQPLLLFNKSLGHQHGCLQLTRGQRSIGSGEGAINLPSPVEVQSTGVSHCALDPC